MSDATAGSASHPMSGSSSVAGSGVSEAGSPGGGDGGAASETYKECQGNRIIDSRDDYLALVAEACTEITGDLLIGQNSDDLATLPPLTTLRRVNRQLMVSTNTTLTSLPALPDLESVGTRLLVEQNPALTALPEMPKLASIGTWFIVRSNGALTSMPELPELHLLEHLVLGGNIALTSLPKLPKLRKLTSLEIRSSPLHDLSGLGGVQSIQRLSLSGPAQGLTGLDSLTSVDSLSLEGVSLSDLSGLHDLVVGALSISNSPNLTSLESLGSGVSVEEVSLSGNEHMTSLNGLPLGRLKSLGFGDLDQLSSLSALSELESLDYLAVVGAPLLSNLHGLERLKNVSDSLYIEDLPQISSLSELSALRSVGHLSLRSLGKLENLDGLSAFSHADRLTVTENPRLSSLAPLLSWSPRVVTQGLEISANPLLSQCQVEQLARNQATDVGCEHCTDNLAGPCP